VLEVIFDYLPANEENAKDRDEAENGEENRRPFHHFQFQPKQPFSRPSHGASLTRVVPAASR
jgi:hypothetical protein